MHSALKEKVKKIPVLGGCIISVKKNVIRSVTALQSKWFYFKNRNLRRRGGDLEITNTMKGTLGYIFDNARGMFSIFRELLDIMTVYGDKNITISFKDTVYNDAPEDNMWEYYFEPVQNELKKMYAPVPCSTRLYLDALSSEKKEHLTLFNEIIRTRIKLRKEILDKIDAFAATNFANKKVIGVHFRGTDIWKSIKNWSTVFKKVGPPEYFSLIDSLLETKKYDCVFLATDEELVYQQFKERYGQKLITYSKNRSTNKRVIVHYLTGRYPIIESKFTKRELGEEVIIDALLLSKSDFFVYGASNVSTVVKFFNPFMKSKNMDLINQT